MSSIAPYAVNGATKGVVQTASPVKLFGYIPDRAKD